MNVAAAIRSLGQVRMTWLLPDRADDDEPILFEVPEFLQAR